MNPQSNSLSWSSFKLTQVEIHFMYFYPPDGLTQ
jgi:hypothetical protein